ncbi:hypothetical protein ACIBG7_35145 [Nonomuraea sp. NPDC050328]|uniref:hypothetical protein n=1 Tax=Nonomuraea sp. NPDC050328 TaxID=3364361 RepID=UPI0037ABB93B
MIFTRIVVAAVLVTTATAGGHTAAPAQENGVTLITGDRVLVAGQGHRVQPGPGRRVSFSRQVREGHLYVIPSDAMPLVAEGCWTGGCSTSPNSSSGGTATPTPATSR